jgi:aspartyl-tRNA(Asn)/glutamyl-tRNA(Gln) amidotransferase subunit B
VSKVKLEEARERLRSSGFEVRRLMVEQDGISHEMAATIADDEVVHRFYRLCCLDGHEPRVVANWVTGELLRLLRDAPLRIEPGALSQVLSMLKQGEITQVQSKEIFEEVFRTGLSAPAVVERRGMTKPVELDLAGLCSAAITENPAIVADIRAGKLNAVQVLVGSVIKKSRGAADPQSARKKLLELLGL